MSWQSRIQDRGNLDPNQLTPHPKNPRSHGANQRRYVEAALEEVGWVREVVVNHRTGYVVDGHLRLEQALANDETEVPAVIVDLSEQEEAQVLAGLDAVTGMADTDDEALGALIDEIDSTHADIHELLDELHPEANEPAGSGEAEGEGGDEPEGGGLAGRFMLPPFSIIDTTTQTWTQRLHEWEDAGVPAGKAVADDPVTYELLLRWFSREGHRTQNPFTHRPALGGVAAKLGRPEAEDGADLLIGAPEPGELEDSIWAGALHRAAGALADNRFAAFVVPDKRAKRGSLKGIPEQVISEAERAGLRYYNDAALLTEAKASTDWDEARQLPEAHARLLVFAKGDPRAAATDCGDVEVEDVAASYGEVLE